MDNQEIAAMVRTVQHRARLRRAGRKPSLLSKLVSWLLVTVPSPSRGRARVRGRLERVTSIHRLDRLGGDAP